MTGTTITRVLLFALAFGASAGVRADRVDQESEALWNALEARDLTVFDAVLAEGVLDTPAFERRAAHYVLCESTRPGREPFLRSILDHGISPDVQFQDKSALDRNALACASTRNNVEAFDILLDAGADTTVDLCANCAEPRTLFTITAIMPPFSSRILDRRRLTPFEVNELARQVESRSMANSHEGQPTYEWYQDVLRDYGIDGLEPFSAGRR